MAYHQHRLTFVGNAFTPRGSATCGLQPTNLTQAGYNPNEEHAVIAPSLRQRRRLAEAHAV